MSIISSKDGDFNQQIVQLWTVSLVLAILFFVFFAIKTYYVYEESSIRRESYLANLDQLYQQELQECAALGAAPAAEGEENKDDANKESTEDCVKRINEEGRYAQLVKKWGGEDALKTSLQ